MLVQFRYTGTSDSNFTNNQIYVCLGFSDNTNGMFVSNTGTIVPGAVTGGSQVFNLVSVETEVGKPEQIYP